MDIWRYSLAQLRGGWRRTLASALAVLTAVTSFVLLTGNATTERLVVTDTLNRNRGAYDILVRPAGSATAVEQETGQVRASFLSGTYGGITLDQVAQVTAVPGVEVAAPVAMVGTIMHHVTSGIDITDLLPADGERLLLRYQTHVRSRNGHVDLVHTPGTLYVTRQPLSSEPFTIERADSTVSGERYVEVVDGATRHPCLANPSTGLEEDIAWWEQPEQRCVSLASDPLDEVQRMVRRDGRTFIPVWVSVPVQVAAIDPVAEAKLVGLDAAVVAGRALTDADGWDPASRYTPQDTMLDVFETAPAAPALLVSSIEADYTVAATVERLPDATAAAFTTVPFGTTSWPLVRDAPSVAVLGERAVSAPDVYADFLADFPPTESKTLDSFGRGPVMVASVLRPGEVAYAPGTPLRPEEVDLSPAARAQLVRAARTTADTAWRSAEAQGDTSFFGWESASSGSGGSNEDPNTNWTGFILRVAGHVDPDRLQAGGELGRLPLEEYSTAKLTPADDASRAILGGQDYLPDLNPVGYGQLAPSILIPLDALPLLDATNLKVGLGDAPVSAIRVRVAGVPEITSENQERIRLVAQQISQATGLDVDITYGSSIIGQRVKLPASKLGVPALTLDEQWAKKGVAVQIVDALDTKSVALFGLILISSALTVSVVARATVAARRRELGILKASGWPAGRVTQALLAEAALIGGGAGVVGALLAWPLTAALGVAFEPWRALLAIPTAVALTVLASLPTALGAARRSPIADLSPPVHHIRRPLLRVRGPVSLGVLSALRRPGRLFAGALAVALGVGSLLFLVTLAQQFAGSVVGTPLGDAIAVQVRTPDLVAAVLLGVLALIAVGVIGFLDLTEDAPGYASLMASGWRVGRLGTALVTQSVLIVLVGSLVGIAAGYGAVRWLTEAADLVALLVLGGWLALAMLAGALVVALVPAAALARLPLARILGGE